MHLGAFDDEPATVALMDAYLEQNGYVNDMNMERLHHEIYLSDARKAVSYTHLDVYKRQAKGNIMKIEYTKVGDYYLPNLYYPEETRPIGFWGMLRKEYLKEHKSGTYTYLLLTARLDSYLACLLYTSRCV